MTAKTVFELVRDAKSQLENLTPDQVAAEVVHGALLVDVREASERAQAAIPGSLHVPRGLLEFKADPSSPGHVSELNPTRRIILHCASGGRSALAAMTLRQLGFTNVAHLEGGIRAWAAAGKPVERG